jgi:hypothetical protein
MAGPVPARFFAEHQDENRSENFGNFTRAEKTAKMVFADIDGRPVMLVTSTYHAG